MKKLTNKKVLLPAALAALMAAPVISPAQSETWFQPQYGDGQSGSLNWADIKWSSGPGSNGPWVEAGAIPGIDILPDEKNKVFLYYGTSLGPVSGLIVDESTNVAITGLISRYETLRTTEFTVEGTLTFTGQTEGDVGLRFSDTQAAIFKVASNGKFYIEDATGTFGVISGSVSSVSVDGGLTSLNSNNGNITFTGISADNSAQIEVKTSVFRQFLG